MPPQGIIEIDSVSQHLDTKSCSGYDADAYSTPDLNIEWDTFDLEQMGVSSEEAVPM